MNKIFAWIKKNVSTFSYIIFGAATLVMGIVLMTWSLKSTDITVLDAEVVINENTQTEYLVGQTINTDELYLNIGSKKNQKLISANECTIDANLSSAGYKKVVLTYEYDEYTHYQGSFDIDVLFVRNIQVEKLPSAIEVDSETKTFSSEDFVLYAEVASEPKTNYFEYQKISNSNYLIKLNSEMYSTSVIESARIAGYYTANVYCGNLSYAFNFFNVNNKTLYLTSEKDIVFFESDSADYSGFLVVTNRDASYQIDCVGNTSGFYIISDKDDNYEFIDFSFELTEHEELFKSQNVLESYDEENNAYTFVYKNNVYRADANLWQSAVVNGLIYNDGGFKLVADSDSRVLHLNYLPESDNKENNSSLTLYVTSYTFDTSTGGGISQGFYIYTNSIGETYKIKFFMQTWVWDYVPLSATKADNEDVALKDYLTTQYNGDLVVEVSSFVRGEGRVTYKFTAEFGEWRLVAYNMA